MRSVLRGKPAGGFAHFASMVRAVRREYAHVTDDDWRTGRAAVLRGFADRPRIYADGLGLDDWEHRARANIAAELAMLTGGGASA